MGLMKVGGVTPRESTFDYEDVEFAVLVTFRDFLETEVLRLTMEAAMFPDRLAAIRTELQLAREHWAASELAVERLRQNRARFATVPTTPKTSRARHLH